MEIPTSRPRRGRLRRLLVNLVALTSLLFALALVLPSAFGLQRYVITGTSMTGTYDVGSVVFAEVVEVEELRVGDVITYMPPPEAGVDELVTHRIVSISKRGAIRTKGDAVGNVDPWSFRLGSVTQPRVVFGVPWLGWVFVGLADRTVRVTLIGIPAALIALRSLLQIVAVLRRRRQERAPLAQDLEPRDVERVPVAAGR